MFDTQERSYAFVEHSAGELVVEEGDERATQFESGALDRYVIHLNRTDRGLAIT